MALNSDPLPIPDSDQSAEHPQPNDTRAWLRRALQNMDRMSKDEEYRKEIVKRLF